VQEGLKPAPLLDFSLILQNTNLDIFFVEYAELRVLPFDPVVEKNVREVARNPDILISGGSGIDYGLVCSWIFFCFPQLWKNLWKTWIHR
jgi:hypothetical protein